MTSAQSGSSSLEVSERASQRGCLFVYNLRTPLPVDRGRRDGKNSSTKASTG